MASSTTCSSPTHSSASGTSSGTTAAPTTISATNIVANPKTFTFSEEERLNYEIYRYSSYSPSYLPENILVDCPNDQTSRWSAYTNSPPQYLTLKLKRPAIVKKIKFGKFEKPHVCNIKKFRIFGGLEDEHMVLLLEAGLKNDNVPEVFSLRCITENASENLPILYLKIVPLLSWGPSFNFSIWYIELHGQDDPMYTCVKMQSYNILREVEIIKLCLKHFRQQGYSAAFNALQEQTNVQLEHEFISELHNYLVVQGDFKKTETFIAECIEKGLMDGYLNKQNYKHVWQMQETQSEVKPGNRGGHQLVVDGNKRLFYLYGGWDGFQDLSDLWVYSIEHNTWTLLFEHCNQFNGPSPRSCHKMVFDPISENIFMLGRYIDNSIRTTDYIKSDFFLYDTRSRTWLQICDDTSQVGGPQLVYDHQMCLDVDKRIVYVFGGKILTPRSVTATSSNEPEYSGLFSYHIATNTWTQIFVDCHHISASQADVLSIKSRFTHCMVFHSKNRKLYIYGGQRGKEDIDEFLSYDVDTQTISVLNKDHQQNITSEAKFEPSPGYTLRATIDCERDEIYIFSSLSKMKDRRDIQHIDASNSFWVYSLQNHRWSRIYYCRHNLNDLKDICNGHTFGVSKTDGIIEPCPRYAHQLVYDEVAKLHYLFGGNPGFTQMPQLRLNDFWTLKLEKPKREEILRHCRFLVRKLRYEELVQENSLKAMEYLRHHVAEAIDPHDVEQLKNFHKLAALLFKTDTSSEQTALTATPPLGANINAITMDNYAMAEIRHFNAEIHASADFSNKSDVTNPVEDLSIESCESAATSGISDAAFTSSSSLTSSSVQNYRRQMVLETVESTNNQRKYKYETKTRRAFLFNKLVQLMPESMVQPERNLSDFVVM